VEGVERLGEPSSHLKWREVVELFLSLEPLERLFQAASQRLVPRLQNSYRQQQLFEIPAFVIQEVLADQQPLDVVLFE
tara:strand:+ start:68 stop:301 length:234 start_codon:yes stop_codon:yes gene_type:complete